MAWHHPNGRDWSVRAFLTLRADGVPAGPGLDIAGDSETRAALLRAVAEVARTPLDELRGRRLDANAFNRIAGVEIERDILRWLGDPAAAREAMGDARWDAFRAEARGELGFDPEAGSDVEAGAKLARGRAGRADGLRAVFFSAPRAIRVHLHAGAVQPHRLHLDAYDPLPLQVLEHAVQHTVRRPAVHPSRLPMRGRRQRPEFLFRDAGQPRCDPVGVIKGSLGLLARHLARVAVVTLHPCNVESPILDSDAL